VIWFFSEVLPINPKRPLTPVINDGRGVGIAVKIPRIKPLDTATPQLS